MFGVLADNPALTLFLVVVGRRARLADAPGVADGTVRFSFWRHGRSVEVASDQAVVEPGDHVVVIGAEEAVPEVTRYLGDTERRVSEVDAVSLGLGLSRATPPCSPLDTILKVLLVQVVVGLGG
jgi:hypothetical protein